MRTRNMSSSQGRRFDLVYVGNLFYRGAWEFEPEMGGRVFNGSTATPPDTRLTSRVINIG